MIRKRPDTYKILLFCDGCEYYFGELKQTEYAICNFKQITFFLCETCYKAKEEKLTLLFEEVV